MLLLEKLRKINKLLKKFDKVKFDEISKVLSSIMHSNVYIVGKTGAVLGYACLDDFECVMMREKVLDLGQFSACYVEWMHKMKLS